MNPARLAAVRALTAIEHGGTTLANEMERARRRVDDVRDRGLLLEIVAGVERWRAQLDFLIDHVSRRPVADLDAVVRAVLRAAAYQLRHLERVPAHAIVDESVDTVRRLGHASAAGFVNAVLRALDRLPTDGVLPGAPADIDDRAALLEYLTVTQSHPEWLVRRWIDRYGPRPAADWCAFNNGMPELTLRPLRGHDVDSLTRALDEYGVHAEPARFVDDAVRVAAGALGRLPGPVRAMFMVQEEASQLVARAVGAAPGERVLDTCAAPGGKTIVLGASMRGAGLLVAADRRPARVALLRSILHESETRAVVVTIDATQPLPFGAVFDRVLVDAPCSGLGTIRRDPDVKWSRTVDDLARFAAVQKRMLQHAAAVVVPGGQLVYATCSSEPDENDAVVDAFLAERDDFQEQPIVLPGVRAAETLVGPDGRLRTLPFRHALDAFFAARLRRLATPGPAHPL